MSLSPATGCQVFVQVDSEAGVLACWLLEEHGGLHYDEADEIYWQTRAEQEAESDA